MRINTNIASLQAQRNLSNTTKAFARALERLSSGKRINRAGDDAAGLAISERLQSEVRGLSRTAKNVNEAFGLLNTAEGALSIQTDLVQRMRELAVQSANGTISVSERQNLDGEFQTLAAEFERISESTQFNGVNLLDGNFESKTLQVGTQKGQTIEFELDSTVLEYTRAGEGVTGTGSFTNSDSSTGINNDASVITSDVNNDGHLDFLHHYNGHRTVYVELGNGDGTFTAQAPTLICYGKAFQAGDFNGDGKVDLAFSDDPSGGGGGLGISLGNGDGTFQAVSFSIAGGSLYYVDPVRDINADGKLDIIGRSSAGDVLIHLGNGDGTFGAVISTATGGGGPIDLGDLNGDGKLDLVSGNSGGNTKVMLGNGDGTFGAASLVAGTLTSQAKLFDINEDGKLDLIGMRDNSNALLIRLGNGDSSFQSATSYAASFAGDHNRIDFGDFDGDDKTDIILGATQWVAQPVINIFYGNGDGTLDAATALPIVNSVLPSVGDYNEDGVDDFLAFDFTSPYTTNVYLQDTEGEPDEEIAFEITTQLQAQDVLEALDDVLDRLASQRANIGAQQNRLESALSSILISQENMTAARSQILDADIATETAELTRAQILQQAGVSVLGQANMSLQVALTLLGGINR